MSYYHPDLIFVSARLSNTCYIAEWHKLTWSLMPVFLVMLLAASMLLGRWNILFYDSCYCSTDQLYWKINMPSAVFIPSVRLRLWIWVRRITARHLSNTRSSGDREWWLALFQYWTRVGCIIFTAKWMMIFVNAHILINVMKMQTGSCTTAIVKLPRSNALRLFYHRGATTHYTWTPYYRL